MFVNPESIYIYIYGRDIYIVKYLCGERERERIFMERAYSSGIYDELDQMYVALSAKTRFIVNEIGARKICMCPESIYIYINTNSYL